MEICASIYDKKVSKEDDVFADGEVLMENVRPLIQSLVKKYHTYLLPQFNEVLAAMQSRQQHDLITNLERILASSA